MLLGSNRGTMFIDISLSLSLALSLSLSFSSKRFVAQLGELFRHFLESLNHFNHAFLSMNLIIPRSDIDCAVLLLSLADDQDEIVLRQLIVSNLLIEGVRVRGVGDDDKARLMEGLTNLVSVFVEDGVYGYDGSLSR